MSVLSVSVSSTHSFSKSPVPAITLLEDLGVKGDAHAGVNVQHLSRTHITPPPRNLRQVHLIHSEVLTEAANGTPLTYGALGENITTSGIDLLALGQGTKLRFVDASSGTVPAGAPVISVTGLRNPCPQIDKYRAGLKERFFVRDSERKIVGRKAGIMAVVEVGGEVRPGMRIVVEKPASHTPLECV
ncbi:hypothetical protein LOZ39_000902 [Ophidiomyces ophidiicola]|uniref:Uncharacterized protein n=1 Tax=Ophidiomyces ophidiicola TaxID=1387563 RepID=A0ACB8V0G4_9EURO|nr:hypothetical protein LOZ64_004099 [Ophidiomyces ophidiicola]KAI1917651.1 hypothetical protein LOZ61_000270 [Ophidiomyces ophidiicola]KAI1931360.1 hypothetical protein LOZ60_000225 [Ophidiomyces ophidiicola]KAI1960874.1 hypothetical protein LOZ59_002569 [Ophidiomyces ophidiicola]KAI1974652.1 hypothetical protein LOZ56_001174 [Ophidiomyces ophidiicola]